MREFKPSVSGLSSSNVVEFLIGNLNSVSASIKSILTQTRLNKVNTESNAISISNASLEAWTTANRPTATNNANVIGINTTTGNLNYTTDNGATWKNYDGTAA